MLLSRLEEIREFRTSTELSDICVVVDKTEFRLHKFPLFVNSEFFRALCRSDMMDQQRVTLPQFPGGAKTFSLIADYCYGLEVNINSNNVVELRCAAEFLQMTSHGNLASEANTALTRILRSQPTSESHITDILFSACHLGAIANQTNIIPLCFDTVFVIMEKGNFSESITEVLMELPIEWFVGFIIGARDASVSLPKIARLAGQYLERILQQHKDAISEFLEPKSPEWEVYEKKDDMMKAQDFADIVDAILIELPESTSLSKVMDNELLCLLFRLAVQLQCKCEGVLLKAISNNLSTIPRDILVTMPTSVVVSIAEHSMHIVPPTILCNAIDNYLWARTKQNTTSLDEFQTILLAIPKAYRPQHDSILLIVEEFFSKTKVSEETKLQALKFIDPYKLDEETLRKVSERGVIPLGFIVSSALAVSSRLRNELTEAKAKLTEKEREFREIHASVSDAIKGQWKYNDVTLNVTPKDATNTRVQFAKVQPRDTSSELLMEHEVYDGKLTLCVRASHGSSTHTFMFDPFSEQLMEITKSKHDNLMIGENYQKKRHATSYWPFADVAS